MSAYKMRKVVHVRHSSEPTFGTNVTLECGHIKLYDYGKNPTAHKKLRCYECGAEEGP